MVPKKYTCWFWHITQDCRFTDKECVHRHWVVPGEPVEYDLYKGRPRWGAADDYASTPSLPSVAVEVSDENPDDVRRYSHKEKPASIALEETEGLKKYTCFFWATKGSCSFPTELCKYSHEEMPAGIAPKQPEDLKKFTCSFWATKGSCFRSDDACKYSHADMPAGIAPPPYTKDSKRLTCHYWANGGSCTFDDETCKYSHREMPAGNAPPPGGKWGSTQSRKPWDGAAPSWRKEENLVEESLEDAEVASPNEWGNSDFIKAWGQDDSSTLIPVGNNNSAHTWGTGTPTHLQELQSIALQQEVGW